MDNNNSIIKYQSTLLTKVSKQLVLTNKLLAKHDDQKYIDFFLEHPDFFCKIISRFYNLNSNLIENLKDKLDWIELSNNEYLEWFIEFIEKYKDKWCWNYYNDNNDTYNGLLYNKSLPWTMQLLDKFIDKWDFKELSDNYSNLILIRTPDYFFIEIIVQFQTIRSSICCIVLFYKRKDICPSGSLIFSYGKDIFVFFSENFGESILS